MRALETSQHSEVEAYLDGFIPPHCRRPAPAALQPAAALLALQAQQQEEEQQLLLLQRPSSSAGSQAMPPPFLPLVAGAVPAPRGPGAAMQQYAAGMQPAGFKRPRGRPRIHPPGQGKGKKGRPAQAAAAAAAAADAAIPGGAASAALRGGLLAAAAAAAGAAAPPEGELAGPLPAPADGDAADGTEPKPQRRRGPRPLAEATYIGSEERRQQVGLRGWAAAICKGSEQATPSQQALRPWLAASLAGDCHPHPHALASAGV